MGFLSKMDLNPFCNRCTYLKSIGGLGLEEISQLPYIGQWSCLILCYADYSFNTICIVTCNILEIIHLWPWLRCTIQFHHLYQLSIHTFTQINIHIISLLLLYKHNNNVRFVLLTYIPL